MLIYHLGTSEPQVICRKNTTPLQFIRCLQIPRNVRGLSRNIYTQVENGDSINVLRNAKKEPSNEQKHPLTQTFFSWHRINSIISQFASNFVLFKSSVIIQL